MKLEEDPPLLYDLTIIALSLIIIFLLILLAGFKYIFLGEVPLSTIFLKDSVMIESMWTALTAIAIVVFAVFLLSVLAVMIGGIVLTIMAIFDNNNNNNNNNNKNSDK